MDLRAFSFRCFVILAEDLSFTRAAERAGLTQSALSMRIREMERQLGISLFHRSSRSVTLTTHGTELLDQARRIVTESDRFEGLCEQLRHAPETDLVIAVPLSMIGNSRWMRLVDKFRALEPNVTVRLSRHASPDVIAAVESLRADIGFIAGQPPAPMPCIAVGHVEIGLALPEECSLADKGVLRLEDLAGLRIAAFDRDVNPGLYDECFSTLASAGAELVPSPEGILGSGFAARERIAMLAFPGARQTFASQSMREIPLEGFGIKITLCVLRSDGSSRRSVRRFWELARQSAEA